MRVSIFPFLMFFLVTTFGYVISVYPQQDTYLAFAQVMPQPEGGIGEIFKHIKYPAVARNAGVEGKVYLQVFIDASGMVTDVKVLKGIGAGCDEAAVAAVKETKFSPGKNNGAPVNVKLSIPITFQLSK